MMKYNSNLASLKLSGIRGYTALARQTEDCLMLTLGEPDFDTPAPICEALSRALAEGQTHYAPNQGLESLRKAVARQETKRGCACTEENILITAGATGAIFTAMLGTLEPGDEVILPTPVFPLYRSCATVAGAKVVTLPVEHTDFQITPEALKAVITPKTRMIVLNSPGNPSGSVYNEGSLAAVKEAVLGKDIYVLCDNVYAPLAETVLPDMSTDPELASQVLLCQSFSKPYAMTGWRIGYLAAPKELLERLLLLHAAQVAAVPTFVQTACLTALETDITPMRNAYRERRDYVCGRLSEMGLTYPTPEGAFYVFADIRKFGISDEEFCSRLIREGKVATVPGSCFETPGYIRISYAASMEVLEKAMDRLENFLKTL